LPISPTINPTINATPTPISITGQTEYDLVTLSDSNPPTIIFIEAIQTSKSFWGIAYFHNGTSWSQTDLLKSNFSVTETNTLIQLENQINITFTIDDQTIGLNVPQLYTPIVIRAKNEFSKFGGSTNGFLPYLTINNNPQNVRVGLLKGFNRDPKLIDVYDLGINTDWIMFWDQAGNFFHLDKTSTEKINTDYPAHEFYAIENFDQAQNLTGTVNNPKLANINRNNDQVIISTNESVSLTLTKISRFERPAWQDITQGYLISDGQGGYGVYLSFTPLSSSNN